MRPVIGALLVATALLVPNAARGSCIPTITFGQLSEACGGGTAYCYVLSPGTNTTDSILGSFWGLGSGNPAVGQGNDNGLWPPREQWLQTGESGSWLGGAWSSSPQIDGCIAGAIAPGETSEIMVLQLSDQDIFASRGLFAAAAVGRQPAGVPQFDFAGGLQEDILLTPIPRARFTVSSTFIHFFPPPAAEVASGFYTDGTASQNQVIVGYRIYSRTGWPTAQNQRRSAWTAFSPVVPINQDWATGTCFCCGGNSHLEFATALVFSGGFESEYVSRSRKVDPCIPENSQDLDGDGHPPPEFGDDCDDDDDTIYPGAPEVNDGQDNQCPFGQGSGSIDEISGKSGFHHAGDKTKFTWWIQDGASVYEVARSSQPDFAGPCSIAATPLTTWIDPEEPPPGGVFHYLVRAATPHAGSWGTSSAGTERTVSCSPWP